MMTRDQEEEKELTIRELLGMVGRSAVNSGVNPKFSTTQSSLSHSIMVLSKSNMITNSIEKKKRGGEFGGFTCELRLERLQG